MSEQMKCTIGDKDEHGVGRCACSLIMAMRGVCKVYGPPPTFTEAFPYLAGGVDS